MKETSQSRESRQKYKKSKKKLLLYDFLGNFTRRDQWPQPASLSLYNPIWYYSYASVRYWRVFCSSQFAVEISPLMLDTQKSIVLTMVSFRRACSVKIGRKGRYFFFLRIERKSRIVTFSRLTWIKAQILRVAERRITGKKKKTRPPK